MANYIVSGDQYYTITGQLAEITRQVRQQNGYPFDTELLIRHLQNGVEGKFGIKSDDLISRPYLITLDFSQSLSQMIAAGNYDYVDSDITAEHFPIQGEGVKTEEIVLFHFNRDISSEAAGDEMDKAGYRPADAAELCALGAQNPKLQLEFPIVAFDSVWRGYRGRHFVPVLGRAGSLRGLDLRYYENDWKAYYRFAAVRKYSTL